jgi:hypothetical protein
MSKTELKKYLRELTKEQLEDQVLTLYDKFSPVKTYYDFVFHPNERKLAMDARSKIAQEYFPVSSRRPKLRRSTAQQIIKHFLTLEVDPYLIADIMLFAIEIAQTYKAEKPIKQEAFYKGMQVAFSQAVHFVNSSGIGSEYKSRIDQIYQTVNQQKWPNAYQFEQPYFMLH